MMDCDPPRIESPPDIRRFRCRKCAAYSCLIYSILDSRRGTTARFYRCLACGEHVWDDGVEPIQGSATQADWGLDGCIRNLFVN